MSSSSAGTKKAPSLLAFVQATTAQGAIVHTDGLQSYRVLQGHGYEHRRRAQSAAAAGEQLLPRAHRAISNLKAWRQRGKKTLCGVAIEARGRGLDEFVFRHNRRATPMAGFQTLLGLGVGHEPITYRNIIDRAA